MPLFNKSFKPVGINGAPFKTSENGPEIDAGSIVLQALANAPIENKTSPVQEIEERWKLLQVIRSSDTPDLTSEDVCKIKLLVAKMDFVPILAAQIFSALEGRHS